MDEHIPYEKIRQRPCDFVVKYRFYSTEEGGRKTGTPIQGYRPDFKYAEDQPEDGVWMIHPEFLDKNGQIIIDKSTPIALKGKAQMWISNEQHTELHRLRIKNGQKGYFTEGQHKVAECEVIEYLEKK